MGYGGRLLFFYNFGVRVGLDTDFRAFRQLIGFAHDRPAMLAFDLYGQPVREGTYTPLRFIRISPPAHWQAPNSFLVTFLP